MAKDIVLGGFFTHATDLTGVTGLTVTIDVWSVTLADLTKSEVVTAGSCTEIGDGVYAYRIASADLQTYLYFAILKTSDSTVAQKHVAAVMLDFADTAAVWTKTPRTLTQGAASVAAAVSVDKVTVYRDATWSIALTGLGALTGYTTLWFTVKSDSALDSADTAAQVQIAKNGSGSGDGLLILNGQTASDATKGSITIDDASAGDITIRLDESVTAQLGAGRKLNYDVRMLNSGNISVLADGTGKFNIYATATRRTS